MAKNQGRMMWSIIHRRHRRHLEIKFGNMLIMIRETKYINQSKKTVALQRTTGISYQPQD